MNNPSHVPQHGGFAPSCRHLPVRDRADGTTRRIGIELEFAGVDEDAAARILADVTRGQVVRRDDRTWAIETSLLGTCETYLDTRFRDDVAGLAGEVGLDLARLIVPVELVTAPFDPAHMPTFDKVIAALREKGAAGSRQGVLLGFGVHLNVEIADDTVDHLWRVTTSFALLEPYLRQTTGIDVSRRVLPFVQPYPDALVDDLSGSEPADLSEFIETYLKHAPSRNHGLDLLPVMAHLAPDQVMDRITDGTATKPRPAFHFRMPDCRIDEVDWSIAVPWSAWIATERLAATRALFDRLCAARQNWSRAGTLQRRRWDHEVADFLSDDEASADMRGAAL